MPTYECWTHDYETEEDARTIEAYDAADAASAFAAKRFNEGGDPFSEMGVVVRGPDGVSHIVSVDVEYEPVFAASMERQRALYQRDLPSSVTYNG
jgi:hypothetical protein